MEQTKKKMTLPSTSSVESEVVVEGGGVAAAGAPTTTTVISGETAVAVNEATKVYATAEQIRSVFLNGLIADNVMSHLTFGDMKAGRLVSRTFLESVESNKRFKDAQVLLVTKGKCPLSELNGLLDSDRIWRGIKIDVTLPGNQLIKIPGDILKDVQFVCLVSETLTRGHPTPVLPIRHTLMSTPKITHLQMDIRLFFRNLEDVFSSNKVKMNLKQLKHFEILGYKDINGNSDGIYDLGEDHDSLIQNFLVLVKKDKQKENDGVNNNGILTQLESLRVPKVSFCRQRKLHFQSAVMKLLRGNHETLRKLTVHLDIWENKDIAGVKLPHLTSLTVTLRVAGEDKLKDFLANHPSLEELVLDVISEEGIKRNLWDVIKERSANLRKLHLKTIRFLDSEGKLEERVDWTFLAGMTRLKDFALVHPYDSNATWVNWIAFGSGARILASLPKNQLERLSFGGIGIKGHGFWCNWDTHCWGEENVVFHIDPDIPEKLELLRGFRNLKCLSFRRCPEAVDDEVMQFIVKEMTSLEELEVSKCRDLTHDGIFGRWSEDGSDSIRNLQGLKTLSIRSCPSVTHQIVLWRLELPFLRRFNYLAEKEVSKSSLVRMIARNPSLESVSVNMKCSESEVLRQVNNSRLETLVNLATLHVTYESDDGFSDEETSSEDFYMGSDEDSFDSDDGDSDDDEYESASSESD